MSHKAHRARVLRRVVGLAASLLLAAGCGELRTPIGPTGPAVTYVDHIAPLLEAKCVRCHGPTRAEGSYRLDSWRGVFGTGSDFKRNVLVDAHGSELLVALRRPSHAGVLSDAEERLLTRWVVDEKLAYTWHSAHPQTWLDLTQRASKGFHGGLVRSKGWNVDGCRECHGADLRGGSDAKSCYSCHPNGPAKGCSTCHGGLFDDTGLPAPDLAGRLDSAMALTHMAHRQPAFRKGVVCSECHVVPVTEWQQGHLFDGPTYKSSDLRAEVVLGPRARLGGAPGVFQPKAGGGGTCAVYCHGVTLGAQRGTYTIPSWLAGKKVACGSCHAVPMKGIGGAQCAHCHQQSVTACTPGHSGCFETASGVGVRFRSTALHIDGRTPVGIAGQENTCWGCHGTQASKGAPAPDLDGSHDTKSPGVGMHAVHLRGSSLRVALRCSTCHKVPATRDAPGHIDSARPAEVIFDDIASGKKRDGSVSGFYDPATKTCRNVYCHSRPDGKVGDVWSWTQPLKGGLNCASCHKGKPQYSLQYCITCHPGAYKNGSLDPATHMNGKLDYL